MLFGHSPFDILQAHDYVSPTTPASAVENWLDTLCQHDTEKVLALYDPNATLLGTLADRMKTGHRELKDYFDYFLQRKPCGTITQMKVSEFGNIAVVNGTYDFDLTEDGKTNTVAARYTFVLNKVDNQWLIKTHHSSLQP
tara:strand:+ start:20 stop:439 length:420 start_codon:yes stop_codon:yes gene_type:complete